MFLIFAIIIKYLLLKSYTKRYMRWKRVKIDRISLAISWIDSIFLGFFDFFSFNILLTTIWCKSKDRALIAFRHSHEFYTSPPFSQKEPCQKNNRNSSKKIMYLGYISSARCSRKKKKSSWQNKRRHHFILHH